MALLYEKRSPSGHYQVRSAGASVRLYSNGVLHSQYNPRQPIAGNIWDLLLLPAFYQPAPRKILLLGLGGGALLHLLRQFFPDAKITCIEIDPVHIEIAQSYFQVPLHNVQLIEGDAYAFLRKNRGRFDWVLDDVFSHISGEPERPQKIEPLLKHYLKALTQHGVLSFNLIGRQHLQPLLKEHFAQCLALRHPLYDNRIISFLKKPVSTGEFTGRLHVHPLLDQRRKTCRLTFKQYHIF